MSRTRCVFVSEVPVAYRTGWFEHLQHGSELDVRVLYLSRGQSDRPWEQASDAPWAETLRSTSTSVSRSGFFPRVTKGIPDALERLEPDFVVIPGWAHPASWQVMRWCHKAAVPFGVMFETWQAQSQTRVPASVSQLIRDRVLSRAAVSMPVGQRAERFARQVGASKVHLVHGNTCDSESIVHSTAGVARSDQPTVLYVGRLLEHKGAGLLADVAHRLVDDSVRLRVIGSGPLRSALDASKADIEGPKDSANVHRAMAEAHVVVVPSFAEPWGVVVHESLACGTPVVATSSVGSATDLLAEFGGGRIVEPLVEDLVSACHQLIRFAGLRTSREACKEQAMTITYETAERELVAAALAALGEQPGAE